MLPMFERLSPHERVMSLSGVISYIRAEENATSAPVPPGVSRPQEEVEQEPRWWYHVKTDLIYRTGPYNQHLFIPWNAILPDGSPKPAETVIKQIALMKTIWLRGEQQTVMFFIYVEEPIDRATRPTRSIPPSMAAYMGIEPTEGMRVYKQRSQLHTSKANVRAKHRRQRK